MRSGNGGLNQLFLGVGYQPVKNLSVGVNFAYLFGSTVNTTLITSTSTSYFTRNMKVRDWNAQVGLQYSQPLRTGKDMLTLGATFQPKKSFHGNTWGTKFDTQDNRVDTIGYTSMSGKYEQPASIGVGVSYNINHKLTLE
jgi:long-subunit fatty acid transport protein